MMNKEDVVEVRKLNQQKNQQNQQKKSAEKLDMKFPKRHLEIIEILKSGKEYSVGGVRQCIMKFII